METSFIVLILLILVFGAVATKAVMKQYRRNNKDSFRYKDF
jgi:Flp pilus assembly protein TadG